MTAPHFREIDVAVLARSFHELVNRHELLRTTIVEKEGELVQRIDPSISIPLSQIDLSPVPGRA